MKKFLIAIIVVMVVCLAALLGLPYWSGTKIETAFQERVAAMASKNGLLLASQQFERGWLWSDAQTVLRVPGFPLELSAEHRIYHGPLLLGRWLQGNIDLEPAQARIETHATLKISAANSPALLPFSIDTLVGFNGEAHAHIESPARSGTKDNGPEWLGLKGDIYFDAALQHIRTELQAPRFAYGPAEMTDMKIISNVREGLAGHYLGKARFDIGGASFGSALQAKKLSVASESAVQGDNLSVSISYDVSELRLPNGRFGPGRLVLEIRRLDAATLARFQEEMNVLRRSGRPQEQVNLMQLGKLMQLVGELAKKAPEFEITELRLRMGNDEISGKAKFVLDGSKADLSQNPLLILTAAAGDAEVLLPPAILKPMLLPLLMADLEDYRRRGLLKQQSMTAQETAAILDQALPLYLSRHEFTRRLVPQSGHYKLSASLRRGQVLVNGEPLGASGAALLPALP